MIIHAKEPYFLENKEKYQEMLNNVKKMKNNIHNIDKSNYIYKSKTSEAIFNCTITSNEEKKINLTNVINSNINTNQSKNKKKSFFIQKQIKNKTEENFCGKNKINSVNKINLNNDFLMNSQIFKDDYCRDWPNSLNSLNSLNDMMSSTADLSLKEENNNLENKGFPFEKIPEMAGNEINFNMKHKINNFNFDNNKDERNVELDENEDCCSKMTNLYAQEFQDKKIMDYLLE